MSTTTAPARILVVDDAPGLRELLVAALENEGFVVESSEDGGAALACVRTFDPDVVLLDIDLPVLDGVEVCRRLREFSDAYVVMITGRDDELDAVAGFSVGADDYVTKPLSMPELVARVRAMLRRPRQASSVNRRLEVGDLVIDTDTREVVVNNQRVELTKIEFDLLATMASRPHAVFSRAQLMEAVWEPNRFDDDHIIDVHISKLRGKLGDNGRAPKYVLTVRGVGFRLGAA